MKGSLLPSSAEYPADRLFSLDVLRGIDMIYLTVLSGIMGPFFNALGMPRCREFFCSHPWGGFTLYDLIMPLFIFMCGAAVPMALTKRLRDGRTTPAYWRHVAGRFVLLWFLGMVAQGNLATLDPLKVSPYNNTLQTIAVGYVVAAALLPVKNLLFRIAVPLLLAAVYGCVIHFCGDYTPAGNATVPAEKAVLSLLVPADSELFGQIYYTWFLPSLMFPVITMAGCFSVEILKMDRGPWRRAAYLGLFGVSSLSAGWALELAGVESVKQIFTVSFTFQAIGWSVLSLALLFVLTDIWRLRRGTSLLLLFGQSALAAYVVDSISGGVCNAAAERFFSGFNSFFPEQWSAVVFKMETALLVILSLVVWRGYKIYRAGRR